MSAMEGADFRLSGKYSAVEAVSSLRSDILHQVCEFFCYFSMYVQCFIRVFSVDFQACFTRCRYLTIREFLRRCLVWYQVPGTALHTRTDSPSDVFKFSFENRHSTFCVFLADLIFVKELFWILELYLCRYR
jgi:hypothetical protein